MRRCLGCGLSAPPGDLIRLSAPAGTPQVDIRRLAGGRGAHVCYSRKCLEEAFKKRRLSRALKVSHVDATAGDITAAVVHQLNRLLACELERAARMGALIVKQERVRMALDAGSVRLLLTASDDRGDADGLARALWRRCRVPAFPVRPDAVIRLLPKAWNDHDVVAVQKRPCTLRVEKVLRHLDAMGWLD